MNTYNPNFTAEELVAWVAEKKENENNWSMMAFCYMDEDSGDIVIQRSGDECEDNMMVVLLYEDSLDLTLCGEDGCAGNYDMYSPMYSYRSDLLYLPLYSQAENWLKGEIICIHGRKPDEDEYKMLGED